MGSQMSVALKRAVSEFVPTGGSTRVSTAAWIVRSAAECGGLLIAIGFRPSAIGTKYRSYFVASIADNLR